MVEGAKNRVFRDDWKALRDMYAHIAKCALSMPSQIANRSNNERLNVNSFTPQEKHVQQVLAVALSSLGILSALVSFYWFAKIKKSFRHQYVNCCQEVLPYHFEQLMSSQSYYAAHFKWCI